MIGISIYYHCGSVVPRQAIDKKASQLSQYLFAIFEQTI